MIDPKTSASATHPVMYKLLDRFEVNNGRHVVLVNSNRASKGQYPTGKIYNAVTLILLESSMEEIYSVENAILNRKIGFCIVAGSSIQALYIHQTLHDKLIKKKDNEDNGYLIKHNDRILGLINHSFDLHPLDDENYTAIADEATKSLKEPSYILQTVSTFFLHSAPIEGTFPFTLDGSKSVSQGKLSQLDQALDFNFITKFNPKLLKKMIADKKVTFIKFEGGECTSIALHETLCPYVKSYSFFSVAIGEQIGLLKYPPNFISLNEKQFNLMIKEATNPSTDKQTNQCQIS